MKKRNSFIRICISLVALSIIIFSGFQLVKIHLDYRKSDLLYENTQSTFSNLVEKSQVEDDLSGTETKAKQIEIDDELQETNQVEIDDELQETKQTETKPIEIDNDELQETKQIEIDFDNLQKINSDIVGWIYFENEDISYPILFSGDNEKYLRCAYTNEEMTAGSIFVEGDNNPDFSDRHTIIYGHNMRNLSMFGKLKFYRQKSDYYKEHQYFQIITPDTTYRYRIFNFREVNADSDVYTVHFESDADFREFVGSILITDSKCYDVDVTDKCKVVTLSTCSADDKRFIVSAECVS